MRGHRLLKNWSCTKFNYQHAFGVVAVRIRARISVVFRPRWQRTDRPFSRQSRWIFLRFMVESS